MPFEHPANTDQRAAYRCPHCHSNTVRSFKVASKMGRNQLGAECAEPERRSLLLNCYIFLSLISMASAWAIYTQGFWGGLRFIYFPPIVQLLETHLLGALSSIILSLIVWGATAKFFVRSVSDIRYNHNLPDLIAEWEKKWVCLTCGENWIEE